MSSGSLGGLLAIVLMLFSACSKPRASWTPGEVMERLPRDGEQFAHPEQGDAAAVNSPGFLWTPSDQAAAYRVLKFAIPEKSLPLSP